MSASDQIKIRTKKERDDKKLSSIEVVSYGLGDLSGSLAWNAVGAFALYFYTDVALLPAAAIGTLFFIGRLFDAISDIGIGIFVDRTDTRWGRARPYLLFTAIPFGVFTILIFYTPEATENIRLIWAVFTYFMLGLLLSIISIPYSAMLPMMSKSLGDRVNLSVARSVGTSLGVILATAAFMPGVQYFGGGNEQNGFLVMATIIAVASTIMILITFSNCQERVVHVNPAPKNILNDVGMMFRNQAWLSASSFALLNFIRFGAILALTPFFAIHVLGEPWMISVLLPALSGTLLVGAFIAKPILTRWGMRLTDTAALIAAIALYLVLPMTEGSHSLFITVYILASLIVSITMTSIFAMASESVDFHEWRFGVRQEGLLASGVAFSIKVGMAFGASGVAYALALGGYEAGAITDEARSTMSGLYYGVPIGIFVLQIVCIQFYPMDRMRSKIKLAIAHNGEEK